jgi:hypothetical protein
MGPFNPAILPHFVRQLTEQPVELPVEDLVQSRETSLSTRRRHRRLPVDTAERRRVAIDGMRREIEWIEEASPKGTTLAVVECAPRSSASPGMPGSTSLRRNHEP